MERSVPKIINVPNVTFLTIRIMLIRICIVVMFKNICFLLVKENKSLLHVFHVQFEDIIISRRRHILVAKCHFVV